MADINAKTIAERHEKFPDATITLIESYAFSEYKKAISDLLKTGKVVEVENSDTLLIVMTKNDFDNWKNLNDSHWYINKNQINL